MERKFLKLSIFILAYFLFGIGHAEEEHHEHDHHSEAEESFQLSDESMKFLNIEFSQPQFEMSAKDKKHRLKIPLSALVSFQGNTGIYISENKKINLVQVKIIKKENDHLIIVADEFHSDSLIATKGVSFIRTAHLEALGLGGEGHAH